MPRVRQGGAQRWATRTAAATPDYQAGVAAPRQSWQQATVAAADAHKAAMTQALAQNRFAKGVQKAGDAKWQAAASGKGAERFGPGAQAGVQDYANGFAPYQQVIESTPLPPRGPKGDPRNIDRVRVLAAALNKKKTGGSASAMVLALVLVASIALSCFASGGQRGSASLESPRLSPDCYVSKPGRTSWTAAAVGLMVAAGCACASLGAALDTVTMSATAPGGGGAAAAAVAGDSLVIRNTALDQKPLLMNIWVKSQVSAFAQFIHPAGHDQVRDIRMRHIAATPLPLLPWGIGEICEPQDNFSALIAGSAVGGQTEIAQFMVYYPDLPGIQARFIGLEELENRLTDLVTVEDTTTATVAATYSGSRALNAATDLLVANTDYAIMGAHIGVVCAGLTIRGVDTGNLRIPIPGMPGRPDITAQWFVWLTEQYGLPLIPVINSANKAAIFIENVQDQALAAVPFSLMMAKLSMG